MVEIAVDGAADSLEPVVTPNVAKAVITDKAACISTVPMRTSIGCAQTEVANGLVIALAVAAEHAPPSAQGFSEALSAVDAAAPPQAQAGTSATP